MSTYIMCRQGERDDFESRISEQMPSSCVERTKPSAARTHIKSVFGVALILVVHEAEAYAEWDSGMEAAQRGKARQA
jgi:hypothetical protein